MSIIGLINIIVGIVNVIIWNENKSSLNLAAGLFGLSIGICIICN